MEIGNLRKIACDKFEQGETYKNSPDKSKDELKERYANWMVQTYETCGERRRESFLEEFGLTEIINKASLEVAE